MAKCKPDKGETKADAKKDKKAGIKEGTAKDKAMDSVKKLPPWLNKKK